VALLPFEDNLIALQGGPAALVDARHHALEVPSWGSQGTGPLADAAHLSLRPVVADGRIAGFWEYDPDAQEVVLGGLDGPLPAAAHERARDVSAFLAKDVGHGRSFSLDTDDALRERAAWVRALGGTKKKAPAKKASKKKKVATARRAR
jgi:hypothetical protein